MIPQIIFYHCIKLNLTKPQNYNSLHGSDLNRNVYRKIGFHGVTIIFVYYLLKVNSPSN